MHHTDEHPCLLLTNHALVLFCIAAEPDIRQRDIATKIGITERSAQKIVQELETAGYLTSTRVGRRKTYGINPERSLNCPLDENHTVGHLLSAVS